MLGDGITGYPVPNLLHFVMPDLGGILGLVSWKDEHPNRRKNAHHYNLHADKAVLGTVYRSTQQYERVSNFESGKNGVVNKAKPEEAHLTRDITELRVKTEYGDRTRALSYGNAALAQAEKEEATEGGYGVGEPMRKWIAGGSVLAPIVCAGAFPACVSYNREALQVIMENDSWVGKHKRKGVRPCKV